MNLKTGQSWFGQVRATGEIISKKILQMVIGHVGPSVLDLGGI